jgi:hypothetical protein
MSVGAIVDTYFGGRGGVYIRRCEDIDKKFPSQEEQIE